MINYKVYIHTNKINNKRYIGITKCDVEDRWQKGLGYRRNPHFYRAIQKYGWDSFNHLVFAEGLTKEQACKMERQLIKIYKTKDKEFGYNNCDGGEGVSGYHHTEETKERLRKAFTGSNNPNYGKPMTEERKEFFRNRRLGVPLSEETKAKIGNSLRGQKYHDDAFKKRLAERNARRIIRDDGVIFNTVTEAALSVGVKQPAISNALRRNGRSGGHTWTYA